MSGYEIAAIILACAVLVFAVGWTLGRFSIYWQVWFK